MSLLTTFGSNLGFDPKAVIATPLATTPLTNVSTKSITIAGSSAQSSTVSVPSNLGSVASSITQSVASVSSSDTTSVITAQSQDTRIRLRAGRTPAAISEVLGAKDTSNNILSILYETEGLMFPYTPSITVSQSVNWDPISLIQNNYDVNAYQRTPSVTLSVNGIFTTQTQREGEYLMAVLHFLRTVTKSYFGDEDRAIGKAGTPPPVLYFDGYGDFIFKNIPVVVKSYSYAFDEAVDTNIFKSKTGQRARLPAKMTISMELGMQMNMERQRSEFSLEKFRTGKLLSENGGWF